MAVRANEHNLMKINDQTIPTWPAGSHYPDHFNISEPHINYYDGNLPIDNIVLTEL